MSGTDGDELLRIGAGRIEVEILPAIGARLHRLRVNDNDLLRTPDDLRPHTDDPYFYGSYPMAPWCNRVPAGPAIAAGRPIDLPASFPDGTAIHGQVARRAWEVMDAGPDHARLRVEAGGDGWPWRYAVEQRVVVGDDLLRLSLALTNQSDAAMPGGIGFHPWFRRPVRVAIAAESVHPSNLATEPLPVPVSGDLDRRRLEELPEGVDATWSDIGDPPVVLLWPEMGIRATMTVDVVGGPALFIVAARLPGTDAIAVEPQTHAPDGLRRLAHGEPGALTLIEPGESIELAVVLAFERSALDPDTEDQT